MSNKNFDYYMKGGMSVAALEEAIEIAKRNDLNYIDATVFVNKKNNEYGNKANISVQVNDNGIVKTLVNVSLKDGETLRKMSNDKKARKEAKKKAKKDKKEEA